MTDLALIVKQAADSVPGGYISQWTVGTVLLKPLAWLYLEGPRSWGFWGGASMPDICAQLTNTRAQFWNSNAEALSECSDIVQRHYWSYVVLASSVGYTFAVLYTIRGMCNYITGKKTKRYSTLKNG